MEGDRADRLSGENLAIMCMVRALYLSHPDRAAAQGEFERQSEIETATLLATSDTEAKLRGFQLAVQMLLHAP